MQAFHQSQVSSAGHSTGSKTFDTQRFYGAVADARVASLASNQTLQLALLTCAVELTCYCTTGAATFPDTTSKLGQHTAGLDIWEAAGHFLHYLAAETTIPMADSVSNYLLFMRMKVVESVAWQTGSSLYQAICEGGGGSCCPGDYALVSSFLDGVNALARTRVSAVAAGVAAVSAGLSKIPAFGDDCVWLMEVVVQEHLDLLFDQHLSNMVACSVYATARAHGIALSFKKVTDTIVQTFPHHDMQDFKHADLGAESATGETRSGDTRQLYNEIFLPRMEASLQERFPNTYQHNAVASEIASRQALGFKRAPLKSLSATDMNARLTRFGKMQS
ncbi:TPA: Retinoblastoma-associated protein [Trebouxia sp. C0005]